MVPAVIVVGVAVHYQDGHQGTGGTGLLVRGLSVRIQLVKVNR